MAAALLLGAVLASGQPVRLISASEARESLQTVEGLYEGGEYERCRELLDSYLEQQRTRAVLFPNRTLARFYRLRALLAYAFRGEGEQYQQEVHDLLLKAFELDPDLEPGKPSQVPPYVYSTFLELKEEYLARFSRQARRWNLGLLAALVIDPTLLNDPSVLQPGLFFAYNFSERWSLIADLRLPLSSPVWKSIRGEAGMAWYPTFRVRKLSPSISASYQFALDNLETYTHSVSIVGQADLITRSGLGFALRAELIRLDLILGLTNASELPSYRSAKLFGDSFIRVTFANMNFLVFWTF
jgi:hypothetical protein